MANKTVDNDLRMFRGLVALSVLLGAIYLMFLVTGLGGHHFIVNLSQSVLVWIACFATVGALVASHHSVGRLRGSWLLFATGSAGWAAGRLLWAMAGSNPVSASTVHLVSASWLVFAGCAIISLARLDVLPAGNAARARAVLDSLTIGTVLAFFVWTFCLHQDLSEFSGTFMQRLSRVIDPMAAIGLVAVCITVFALTRTHRRLSSVSGLLMCAGVLIIALSESRFVVFDRSAMNRVGTVADLGWYIGFVLLALSAAWPKVTPHKKVTKAHSNVGEFLPSLAAAAVLATLLDGLNGSQNLDRVSEWLALCLIVCVLVRQVVSVLEEQRLTHLLEARVADRTAQLSRREQQFRALVQHSSDVIVILRVDGQFEYVSPSVQHVLGHTADTVAEGTISDIIYPDDRPRVMALLAMATRRPGASMTAEWRVMRSDGTLRQVEALVRNLVAEPAVSGIVLNLRDVTERKELEDQLTHQALHDDLTGLANRSLLRVRVEQALARWLFQNEPFSLLVVDLDDFKAINDSLGHVAGDEVLKTASERIGLCTRRGDTIVRLAGDEFAVLLEGVAADDPEAHNVAQRIIHSVQQPMRIEGRTLALRVSLGLACVTEQVSQAEDILRNADLALHSAKSTRRGGYVQFEVSMHDSALRRVEMEADLRRALDNDELQLYYQPTMDIATGRMDGVEALLRWPHPEKGFISPVDFIPLAEESGLIVPIGTWVLQQACAEVVKWQARYPSDVPLTLNVNLSGKQLDQPDVVETVRNTLLETGLTPGSLVLEMTESVLMENKSTTLAKMNGFVEMGIDLAIDDFGTGYSSLSYLRQFPIKVLKIDRSFVNGIGSDGTSEETALVQAIVDLARTLQMTTVAEGIETQLQLEALRGMGCDIGQGFLLAKPSPAEDVRRLIEMTRALGLPLPAAASNI